MSEPPPPGAEDEEEPLPPGAEDDEPDVPGLETQTDATSQAAASASAYVTDPNSVTAAQAVEGNSAQVADPYAGYAGYDPNAAGYDYSAYWAHYGYQQSAYYPGYYTGYEGYDPSAYAAYASQQAASSAPEADATAAAEESVPGVNDTATPGEANEAGEAEVKENTKEQEEAVQASKAEEEERQRAEEERVKAAQAAAEEATRAAAEEAARQAAEQKRLSEEAAVRAQNLAAQRAQKEQAIVGPTPEVLEQIQRELAEAQEAAAKKQAAEEEAVAEAERAAAAALAAAPAPQQGASKKKPVMLKGAKMAFSSAPVSGVPSTRVTLSKVFAEPNETEEEKTDQEPVIEKQKSIDRAGKLYLPEPMARANRTDYRPPSPKPPRGSRDRSVSRSRSRSRLYSPSRSRTPPRRTRSRTPPRRTRSGRRNYSRSPSRTPERLTRAVRRPSPKPASPPAQAREQMIQSERRQYRGPVQQEEFAPIERGPPPQAHSAYYPPGNANPGNEEYYEQPNEPERRAKREKRKHKRRHAEQLSEDRYQIPYQAYAEVDDYDADVTRERRRRHKHRHRQPNYDEQDQGYEAAPPDTDARAQNPPAEMEARPISAQKPPEAAQKLPEAAQKLPEVPKPEPTRMTQLAIQPPSPESSDAERLPSPPRIADLRRKYGVLAKTEMPKPLYMQTPEPAPSPSPIPSGPPANALFAAQPLPQSAGVMNGGNLPTLAQKLPAQVKEAAQAAAARANEQQAPIQPQIRQQAPPLERVQEAQPMAGIEAEVPSSRKRRHRDQDDSRSADEDGRLQAKAERKQRRRDRRAKKEKRKHEERQRTEAARYSQPYSSHAEGRSRSARHRRSPPLARRRRSRSYTRSSSYSSRSRSYSRSRSPSEPSRAARARSPVIPKRMRMDEEHPTNIAAEISRAAEAARKAASRATTEVVKSAYKLYVGNLPVGLKEADVKTLFSEVMAATGHPASVMSAYMNAEKRFAFVEFTSPEAATRALQLDNLSCQGVLLRVRRPHDYKPEPSAAVSQPAAPPAAPAKPLFPVASQELPRPVPAKTDQAAHRSDSALPKAQPVPSRRVSLSQTEASGPSGPSVVPDQQKAAPPLPAAPPSNGVQKKPRVLRLANMVMRDELLDDDEFDDIVDDIRDEVERKYGPLQGIQVPRPKANGRDPAGVGLVFLAFENEQSAQKAQSALNGRKFGENTVTSSFFEERKFMERKFA